MSQTEFHSGKLKKINMANYKNRGLEHQIPYLEGKGYIFEDIEIVNNYFYSENVVKIEDTFYEIIDHYRALDEDQYIVESNDNKDGTISFMVQFYNGGCGFEEALEEAIQRKKK